MTQTATTPSSAPIDKEEAKYRLLQENFLTPAECQAMVNLVENYGEVGDG